MSHHTKSPNPSTGVKHPIDRARSSTGFASNPPNGPPMPPGNNRKLNRITLSLGCELPTKKTCECKFTPMGAQAGICFEVVDAQTAVMNPYSTKSGHAHLMAHKNNHRLPSSDYQQHRFVPSTSLCLSSNG
ncbi:hypothetical protein PGTUg99_034368 [Puccinia graminis f. sp. tritici]|uniref:Uncharacterized protein n=1 Tax=Puccinia graminis f. sp. tritici TaxID=56615 RepID=A0A5B0P5E2_PUCGR|nr:hypothetical protein PGTUg99_034368 [Puccinia graminis f. sp. tritici]